MALSLVQRTMGPITWVKGGANTGTNLVAFTNKRYVSTPPNEHLTVKITPKVLC